MYTTKGTKRIAKPWQWISSGDKFLSLEYCCYKISVLLIFIPNLHGRVVQSWHDIDVEYENIGTENDIKTVENEMEFGEYVNSDCLFACMKENCTKMYTKSNFIEYI